MTAVAKGPNKKQAQRAATYARLVDIGLRHLHRNGYTATRIVDVCAEAGLTDGAFYVHFTGKEDFFLHVLARRQALRAGWTDVARGHDPATPLATVVAAVLAELGQRMHGMPSWTPVMADFHFHTHTRPEMRERLRQIYDGWIGEIVEAVTNLQASGHIDPGHDPHRLAAQAFALLEGAGTHTALYGADGHEPAVAGLLTLLAAPPPAAPSS